MARPCKSVDLNLKHLTKEEKEKRKQIEDKFKTGTDELVASDLLNDNQKYMFNKIVNWLKPAGYLTDSDIYIIEEYVLTLSYLQLVEKELNQSYKNTIDRKLQTIRSQLLKDFYRLSNELCLSPQSRARIANSLKTNTFDILLDVLKEDG